jgi:LacI family transcriptional regulator
MSLQHRLRKDSPPHKEKAPRVAVLVDTSTGWGRRLIRGIIRFSEKHGPWHLSVQARGQADYFALPHGWKGDGVIARVGSPRMVRELQTARIPVVNVSAIELPNNPFPRVIADYHSAANLAVQHFRERGFVHFAYSGLQQFSYGKHHREAFSMAVQSAGYACEVHEPRRAKAGANRPAQELADVISWLRSLPKPVGIYTWATDLGRQLLEACRLADISVPFEVAVLGGDYDELLCDASTPPLSGIVVPSEQIGHEAAYLLQRLIRGAKPSRKPRLIGPTGIVERRSTDTLAISDPDVVEALRYIRDNACRPIQIADILRAVPISRRSIERRFAELLGHSPAEEIRRLRMAKAKRLLAETSMSMPAIAEACGYGTYNYLTRVFTQENGVTPREFRKRAQAR